MTQPGSLVEVLVQTRGSEVVGTHVAGATTVMVADPTPFDDAGGMVLIDGVPYSYSTVQDAAEAGGSGLTVSDNGDGTFDISGTGLTDNSDGTYTLSSGGTDNGDGTLSVDTVAGGAGTGETFGQLLLTTGLVANVSDMTPVGVWNGSQVLDDLVLSVATGEEGDPPTPVVVTSDQRAFWEADLGPVEPPIAVVLSDDLTVLEDAPGWTPSLNGGVLVNLPDPTEVALDPPTVSPAVKTVQGNASGLTVVTEPVLPSTLLDYYVNGVLVAADQRTTVINLTTTDVAGTAMVLDTDYTVTTLAHNSGGEAPMSTGATARLNPGVTATQIAGILQAGFILTGAIQVGTAMVIDGSALTITHPDGRQTIMRTDGSGNQFVGQGIFDAATFLGSVAIFGQTNFLNGLLTLATGVSDPTSKPAVSANYASVSTNNPHYRGRGLVLDGAGNWITTDSLFNNGVVQFYGTTTGDGVGFFSTPNGFDLPGGVTKLGSNIYVLGKDTSRGAAWYVYIYNTAGTKLGEWAPIGGSNESFTIGNDGTNLLIAKVTGAGNLYVSTYNTSGSNTANLLCGTNAGWTASTTLTGVVKVAVDTATVRYVVSTTDTILVLNTSTGARITGEEFPPAATPVCGLGHDGTNFHTFDGLNVWHYTNLIGIWDFAFTWVDSDAGGTGTAETKASKLLTTAPRKRARWTVSLPSAPPDDGTTDGANTASLYATPTGGTLVRQAALSEGTLAQAFSTLLTSGTASPVSNGFASRTGALGRIKSSGGVWDLLGDNTGKVGPWSWDASGYGTQDNVMASASADATATSTSNVTISGLSSTVTSPGTGAVWMVTLSADVLIGGTAGGNVVELLIDGTPHASQIVSAGSSSSRHAACKRYRITGLSATSHTFTARTRSQGAYTTTVNQTHTTMTVERVA